MENQDREKFSYTYSTEEQEEINRIRKKYVTSEEDKMEHLHRPDDSVTEKATAVSIIIGIVGSFIMGAGMCCTMV